MTNKLGLLIIRDSEDMYYASVDCVQNIPLIDAVMDVLLSKEKSGCKLQELCRNSYIKSYSPDICSFIPWQQCTNEEVGPYAMYLVGYGVDRLKYK